MPRRIAICLLVCLLHSAAAHTIGREILRELPPGRVRQALHRFKAAPRPAAQNWRLDAATAPVIYPTDFGADPTGKLDSTAAFQQAINATLARGSGRLLADGIRDLGGATLDLAGGDYLISAPLVFPQLVGNFRVVQGTIRAAPSFPSSAYLITVGDPNCPNGQHSCNENVGFENLMLDGGLHAAGCLQISSTMGAVVGPQMFFLGFTRAGITVNGGHETMISESWLGQFLYSDKRKEDGIATTANGIEILGNDHYVTNTIVFSAKIGVLVRGAANLLVGVHTWNLATGNGGTGILIDAPGYTQNRVVASYLDYNSLVAVDPQLLTVQECFFLVGSTVVLKASPQSHSIQGLNVLDNQFEAGSNATIIIDETDAKFTSVTATTIDRNIVSSGIKVKATRARQKLYQKSATQWDFDFSASLVFPTIQSVMYTFETEDATFVRHAARPPNGLKVTITTDTPVTGTVYVEVDQSGY